MHRILMLDRVPGVYAIVCKRRNEVYIGQSTNLRHRLRQHMSYLRRGRHSVLVWNHPDYALNEFKFYLLEHVKLPKNPAYNEDCLLLREYNWQMCYEDWEPRLEGYVLVSQPKKPQVLSRFERELG